MDTPHVRFLLLTRALARAGRVVAQSRRGTTARLVAVPHLWVVQAVCAFLMPLPTDALVRLYARSGSRAIAAEVAARTGYRGLTLPTRPQALGTAAAEALWIAMQPQFRAAESVRRGEERRMERVTGCRVYDDRVHDVEYVEIRTGRRVSPEEYAACYMRDVATAQRTPHPH